MKNVDRKKDCYVCVWNDQCNIQNSIKAYIRHRHSLLKVNFSEFFCSNFQDKTEIENQKKVSSDDTDYLNFYSSE